MLMMNSWYDTQIVCFPSLAKMKCRGPNGFQSCPGSPAGSIVPVGYVLWIDRRAGLMRQIALVATNALLSSQLIVGIISSLHPVCISTAYARSR